MTTDFRMVFDARDELLASARECEAEVFLRAFGNTRAQLDEEYGPYEDSSVFLVLADQADTVHAMVRLIAPGGSAGLKTLVDIGASPWGVDGSRAASAVGIDMTSTWEVATLGVRRGSAAHGTRLSLALYHGLLTGARVNAASSFVAILDDRVRHLLGSVGILTRALPGTASAPYLGSGSSTPVYANFAPMVENQRKNYPEAYRLVTLGIGLDGVAVPAPDEFKVRERVVQHPDRTLDWSDLSIGRIPVA